MILARLKYDLSTIKTFLTNDFVDNVEIFTNRYTNIMMSNPDINVDRDEMGLFLAAFFLMRIITKPSIPLYWNCQHILSKSIFRRLIGSNR